MTELCPNCASVLFFDPHSGKLACRNCGSKFEINPLEERIADLKQAGFISESVLENNKRSDDNVSFENPDVASSLEQIMAEIDSELNDIITDENPQLKDTSDEEISKFLEQQIDKKIQIEEEYYEATEYICNQCGASITINDTEASTVCIYCGCPSVVYNRVVKLRKPKMIIPFKITKEEAEQSVRDTLKRGSFVPKQIKNFSADCVRAIYIPYTLTDLIYNASLQLSSSYHSGDNSYTIYYLREGKANYNKIPVEASKTLSDQSSKKLEPYYFNDLVDFDEKYLYGFYSDIADEDSKISESKAVERARNLFGERIKEDISGSDIKILDVKNEFYHINQVNNVMLPAWFVTFRYKDQPHTILVNGQTGKVSGGVPWDFSKVTVAALSVFIIIAIGFYMLFSLVIPTLAKDDSAITILFLLVVIGGLILLSWGIKKITKVTEAIKLTQSGSMFKYVKERQGDL